MSDSTNELDAQIARARERLAGHVEALARKGQIFGRIKARCAAVAVLVKAFAMPALLTILALGIAASAVKTARRRQQRPEQNPSSIGRDPQPNEAWP